MHKSLNYKITKMIRTYYLSLLFCGLKDPTVSDKQTRTSHHVRYCKLKCGQNIVEIKRRERIIQIKNYDPV